MGRAGSDAASAAADLVLTQDDYSTIVRAIRGGRSILDNIRHFTLFLLAANLGEVLVFTLAISAGLSAPLTVLQVLVVNLLTDGLPAIALGADPPEPGVMRRPPRRLGAGLLDRLYSRLVVAGIALGAAAFAAFLIGRVEGLESGRTAAFVTLVAGQLLFVFSARGEGPFWRGGRNRGLYAAVAVSALIGAIVVAVPAAQEVFDTTPLGPGPLAAALGLAVIPFVAAEAHKALRRRGAARRDGAQEDAGGTGASDSA
jgi:Ca2+-transporting ATPase